MRRRLSALLVVTGLLLAAFVTSPAAAGCGLGSSRGGAGTYRSPAVSSAPVLVYGDSITFQAAARLSRLHPQVAVDAYPGRRTLEAVESLQRALVGRAAPRVVVMALGTNDTRAPWSVGTSVRYARALLPARTRLVWLTTYVEPWPGWEQINEAIAAVPGVEVLDWAAVNVAVRRDGSSPLLFDGVHLSCRGADAWLRVVGSALPSG